MVIILLSLQNQYQFIYDVLAEEVLTGFSEMSINSIPDEYRKLLTREADGKTKLQNQYKVNSDIIADWNLSMIQKQFKINWDIRAD